MRKLFSILLMLVLVVSIFTACAGANNNEGDTTQPPTNDQANDAGNDATDDADQAQDDADTTDDAEAGLNDGTYEAEEEDFGSSGWKDNVTIQVNDGKIASVDWNSTSKEGDKDKKTASEDGDYGMVEKGGAIAEWHEQAEKVEAFLVEKQDVDAIELNDDGTTDAIAGVTMAVDGFVDLVKDALSGAK